MTETTRADFEAWLDSPLAHNPEASMRERSTAMERVFALHAWQAATLKATLAERERADELRKDLQFVERWANHHGTKPHMTAEQALGCIQHYPSILAITRSYTDGKVPETRNPWAELEAATAQGKRQLLSDTSFLRLATTKGSNHDNPQR